MSAAVIAFPVAPLRCFLVKEISPGRFVGRYVGDDAYSGPGATEAGSADQVLDVLIRAANRSGLPIVAPAEAVHATMLEPGPMRCPPQPRRAKKTDREKFAEALEKQMIADGRFDWKWVKCEPDYPEGAA